MMEQVPHEPIKLPGEPLPPEAQSRAFALQQGVTRSIRDQRDALERELRDAHLLIAAIVTQHGEHYGHGEDGRYRLAVDAAHLETAETRQLSVVNDPNSGAMLLRVKPL